MCTRVCTFVHIITSLTMSALFTLVNLCVCSKICIRCGVKLIVSRLEVHAFWEFCDSYRPT